MWWFVWGYRVRVLAVMAVLWAWVAGTGAAVAVAAVLVGLVAGRHTRVLTAVRAYERGHVARCRIRWSWHAVTLGAGLVRKGDTPQIKGHIRTDGGALTFRVRPAYGHHTQTWIDQEPALCQAWRCSEIEVRPVVDRRGHPTQLLALTVSLFGVLGTKVDWPFGSPESARWSRATLPIGQFSGGRPATLDLETTPHILIGGPPGGGKSSLLHTIVCGLALLDDECLVLLDMKGVDLEPWRERAHVVAHTAEEATLAIGWCVALMDSRFATMRANGLNKWRYSPQGPHVTVVIDEFAELPKMLYPAVDRLARLSRAAGFSLVICTQRPAAELGDYFTRIRSMTTVKIAMGGLVQSEAQMILGTGNMPSTWQINPPGVGALWTVGVRTRPFRAYWSERDIGEVVAASTGRRPATH